MFTAEGEPILDERIDRFLSWASQNERLVKTTFALDHVSLEPIIPSLQLELSDGIRIFFPNEPDALALKGLSVRLELLSILDVIDKEDPNKRGHSYFIQVDGSGAFDYDSVKTILEQLSSDQPVVLGQRDRESDWGIGRGRKAIEFFEMSLIEEVYGERIRNHLGRVDLPDAQAGCWGINLKAVRGLSLSARNYGLEFDLISSVLTSYGRKLCMRGV